MKHYSLLTLADGSVKLHSRMANTSKENADRLTERLQAAGRRGGYGAPVQTLSVRSLDEADAHVKAHNRKRYMEGAVL